MCKSEARHRRIIIVEDDSDLRGVVVDFLQIKGYDVTGVGSAMDFYAAASSRDYVVAVLDLSLPDQDGLILSRYIRDNTEMRVVILTARTASESELAGYEAGADLYLVKPVDLNVLVASLDNLFSRIPECIGPSDELNHADTDDAVWRIDTSEWRLYPPNADPVVLTGKEYQFLCLFTGKRGMVISKDEILRGLQYPLNASGHYAIAALIYRLRKKIPTGIDIPIKTASGSGYVFAARLEMV